MARANIIGGVTGPNQVLYNDGDGILLTSSAVANQILANAIYSNTGNGIRFTLAGTSFGDG